MKKINTLPQEWWHLFRDLPIVNQIGIGVFVVLMIVLVSVSIRPSIKLRTETSEAQTTVSTFLATQTVGEETGAFATATSWPGEIISPNDADIQPPREGTIVSWNVTIGQYVRQGQVLGKLSAASLTPELHKVLAEQAVSLTQAKARAASSQSYAAQTRTQLNDTTSRDAALKAIDAARKSAEASEAHVRTILRQAIGQHYADFSGNNIDILSAPDKMYLIRMPYFFGATNSQLRNSYPTVVASTLKSLEKGGIPSAEARAYFAMASQLVTASIATEDYSQAKIDQLKKDISADQITFGEAVETYQNALITISDKERELADRSREVVAKTGELERDATLSQNDVKAAQDSYQAVNAAIAGGASIVAPKAGYVSSIVKKVGEFVKPGDPLASISSGSNADKIIRFRIPSNAEIPSAGAKVKVIRPGFAKDIKIGTILGVGRALDGNGAYMADARFESEVDWPAHLSVRVIPNDSTMQTIAVPFDAIWWNEANQTRIWLVATSGIVQSKVVRTGKTFGDAVEILEGVSKGDTYLSQPDENIKEGQKIEQAIFPAAVPEGDGHGHEHSE